MRCLYCDSIIDKMNIYSLFLKQDELCLKCRDKLKVKRRNIRINDIKIETFYEYNSFFKTLLLQYKECYDEALKDVFLYPISEYLYLKYRGYEIVPVPSSEKKRKLRGFDHLDLIFESSGLKINKGLKMRQELIQEGKMASERRLMKNNYYYEGSHIDRALIVDDVITTGSSIIGAYNALLGVTNSTSVVVLSK